MTRTTLTAAALAGLVLLSGVDSAFAQRGDDKVDVVKQRAEAVLARADKNKDGAVTKDEAGKMWGRISSADQNDDGKVTSAEMQKAWAGKSDRGQIDSDKAKGITREEYGKIAREIKAAVASGRLTKEQAKAKLEGLRRRMAGQTDKADAGVKERIAGVLARMDTNKDGAVTKAECGEFWARVSPADTNKDGKVTSKEMYSAWSAKSDVASAKKVWAELEAMVKAGKITKAQAKERFAAYEKHVKTGAAKSDKKSPEAVIKEIQAMVEAGRMTPEQGKQRIEAYRKELAKQKASKAQAELKGVQARIDIAVKAGKITAAQGKERMEAYKKSLKQNSDKDTPRRKR